MNNNITQQDNNSVEDFAGKEIPYAKYNLTKTMYLRWVKFLREYIANGFNGGKAYLKVYKCKDENSARVEAHRILMNPNAISLLADELGKIGLELHPDWVKLKVIELLDTAKQESTRARMIELAAKVSGLCKDTSTVTAIFNNQDDSIVRSRLESTP